MLVIERLLESSGLELLAAAAFSSHALLLLTDASLRLSESSQFETTRPGIVGCWRSPVRDIGSAPQSRLAQDIEYSNVVAIRSQ